MGGFCLIREKCPNYAAVCREVVVERLCDKGADGEMNERPIVIRRRAGDWERPGAAAWMAQATPFDCLGLLQ
jgi:hypothetical protein